MLRSRLWLERRSIGISSNLVFSEWGKIFPNPIATVAAADRIVHHAVVLEFDVPSYRTGLEKEELKPDSNRRD